MRRAGLERFKEKNLKSATLQGKLDGYREDKRRGKELNEDQMAAVAKYEFQLKIFNVYNRPTGTTRWSAPWTLRVS